VAQQPSPVDLGEICREVHHTYRARLMRHVSRKINKRHDAEDICANTWLRFFNYYRKNGMPDCPEAMLRKIANDQIKSWYNRVAKVELCLGDTEVAERLDSRRTTASEEDGWGDSEVTGAVKALRPRQREAVFLHYYLGLRVKAVADEMGVTTDTAKEHIAKALKALRKILGGNISSGGKRKEVRK
jgi:RNA polymerase sigma factor (sigma-70 family)